MQNWFPHKVPPTDPFRIWCNKLVDWVTRSQLQSSDDILVNQTMSGTSLKLAKKVSGGGNSTTTITTTSTFNFRGIWSATPASPYMLFDAVQLQSGINAGMYYSTLNNNTNSPDSGIGWIQLMSNSGIFF